MSLPTGLMMPRPVTATRRVKSGRRMVLGLLLCGCVGGQHEAALGGDVVDGDDGGLAVDALDEAGEDLARTDLDEGAHAGAGHGLDGGDPVDAAGEVLDELRAAGLAAW